MVLQDVTFFNRAGKGLVVDSLSTFFRTLYLENYMSLIMSTRLIPIACSSGWINSPTDARGTLLLSVPRAGIRLQCGAGADRSGGAAPAGDYGADLQIPDQRGLPIPGAGAGKRDERILDAGYAYRASGGHHVYDHGCRQQKYHVGLYRFCRFPENSHAGPEFVDTRFHADDRQPDRPGGFRQVLYRICVHG